MISIGVDTGLRNAITVLDAPMMDGRPRVVSCRGLTVGHKVDLPKTKIRKRKDGGVTEQTQETVIDDRDLFAFWCEVRDEFTRIRCSDNDATMVVTVERCDKVVERARFGGSMGTGLVRSSWVGGEIASLARTIFGATRVFTVDQDVWRKALIVGHVGTWETEDQAIAMVLPMHLENPGSLSNPDKRDSGGVAWFGVQRARLDALTT